MSKTAQQQYEAHAQKIDELMANIARLLEEHRADFEAAGRRNWSAVGDLGHIRESLSEINDFLTIGE